MSILSELPIGSSAILLGFTHDDEFSERVKEMGLTEGTTFRVIRRAPLRGPLELQIGASRLAIRSADSSHLLVRPVL